MRRMVWSLDELWALLQALALAGCDLRTLAILAAALGLPTPAATGAEAQERKNACTLGKSVIKYN